jgi:hypothetical protein
MSFLTNPYVFGILIAVSTAALVFAYQHTVEGDEDAKKKTFYKTLAAGTVSALTIAYFVHRPPPVSSEPFLPDAPVVTAAPAAV